MRVQNPKEVQSSKKLMFVGAGMVRRVVCILLMVPGMFIPVFSSGNEFGLKGDFRLRSEWEGSRFRERIRLRLSVRKDIDKVWTVGFGFATGGSNPRSTNQTLDNSFERPDLRLDRAYVEFRGMKGFRLWGGKYKGVKEAICYLSDLLWDSDLRPEGVGSRWMKEIRSRRVFINSGIWILDERKGGDDPYLFYVQPVIETKNFKRFLWKAYVGCYIFENVKGDLLDHSSGTNTRYIGVLRYDYKVVSSGLSVRFEKSSLFSLSVFGEYAINTMVEKGNKAYLFGGILEKGTGWTLKFMQRRLEKDAWLDIFPDSDAFNGQTGVEGQEVILEKRLTEHAFVSLDYYHMKSLLTGNWLRLMQIDLLWKF